MAADVPLATHVYGIESAFQPCGVASRESVI